MQIRPRSFYYRMPKKAVRAATKMAIASKLNEGQVVVIDKLEMTAPKTKDFAGVLKALGLEGVTTLVATNDYDSNVYLSARNLPGVAVTRVADLNALSILRPKRVLLTREALESLKAQATAAA